MSYGIYAYIFDKSKLEKLQNSKNKKDLKEIQDKIKKRYNDPLDEENRAKLLKMIEDIIYGKSSFKELEKENDEELFTKLLLTHLIWYAQDMPELELYNSNFYDNVAFGSMYVENKLLDKIHDKGIFNEYAASAEMQQYAFYTNEETKEIKRALNENKTYFFDISDTSKEVNEELDKVIDSGLGMLVLFR